MLRKKFTRKLVVAISLFALLSYSGKADAQCNSVQLSVGDASGRVSRANESFDITVDVTGCTSGTEVNGFTLGIGYDSSKLTFVSGAAGSFVNTQGGVSVSGNIDKNGFNVSIFFRIVNSPEPIEVSLFLERIR